MNSVESANNSRDTLDLKKSDVDPLSRFKVYTHDQAFHHMTRKRSKKDQLLYMILDDVLFKVWDCCCLSINEQYHEEYLPYLPHAFDLLCSTTDGNDLYDYLVYVEETEFHTFKGDILTRRRASRVVDLLLQYKETIFKNELSSETPPRTGNNAASS